MTASPSVSVRLTPELKARLHAEAERVDRPLGYVMQKAVEAYLDAAEDKRAAIRAAAERADAGHMVPGEAVHAWIESWDTDDEAPIPTVEKLKRRARP